MTAILPIASSTLGQASSAKPSGGFLADVTGFAKELAKTAQQGETAAIAGVSGAMPVQQVVETVLQAERAVTTMVAVRDKVVSSLLELTRMQI